MPREARSRSSAPPPPSKRFARLCDTLPYHIGHGSGLGCLRSAVAPPCLQAPDRSRAYIFEYDPRFSNFGSAFVKYDFNSPELIPEHLRGACDYIMADPPYLNPDAVAKFARTIRLLARQPTGAASAAAGPEPEPEQQTGRPQQTEGAQAQAKAAPEPIPVPVLYLSGAVTREWVADELGLRPNTFRPTFA